jgi:hypothetical protein
MNRAGDFSAIYKMILFVESVADLPLMPHSFENISIYSPRYIGVEAGLGEGVGDG